MRKENLGIKCPMCGEKQHKDYLYCSKCGLWLSECIINNDVIEKVEHVCEKLNVKGKWFEKTDETQYKFYAKKVSNIVSKIAEQGCALTNYTFAEIEALIRIETYLYKKQYVNISKDMADLTGQMMLFVACYQDIYEFWQKKAIKSGVVEQMRYRISDCLSGLGSDGKVHKHEAEKIIRKLRNLKFRG